MLWTRKGFGAEEREKRVREQNFCVFVITKCVAPATLCYIQKWLTETVSHVGIYLLISQMTFFSHVMRFFKMFFFFEISIFFLVFFGFLRKLSYILCRATTLIFTMLQNPQEKRDVLTSYLTFFFMCPAFKEKSTPTEKT